MLASYTLTNGEWKKISAAGEDGHCWLKSFNGSNPIIKISHTDQVQDPVDDIEYDETTDLDIDIAYRLPDKRISDALTSDNGSDIFYATILNTDKTCEIITDFI